MQRIIIYNSYRVKMACISHMGYIRENNEDNFCFDGHVLELNHRSMEKPLIFHCTTQEIQSAAVFDGMGGENAGEAASYAAAEKFCQLRRIPAISKSNILRMMEELNSEVCMRAERDRLGQIGCTATALFFHQQYVYLTNVGDSPAYIFRNGKLKLISRKHTDEEFLKCSNARGRKPVLTQFLGILKEEMVLEPYLAGIEMQMGDIFLICTDGLTDMVSENEICNILKKDAGVCRLVNDLLMEALGAGGCDNTTVICCKVGKEKE